MKIEPKIGDYVGFKNPFVPNFPIGIIESIEKMNWVTLEEIDLKRAKLDRNKPMYKIRLPNNMPVWRQASGLKKSSKKSYVNQTMLKMLEGEKCQ